MPGESPTVRRRQLGRLLRRRREELGLSAQYVASKLLVSPAKKISRLETGRRPPTLRDVRDLCDLYKVSDPLERDTLMDLARRAREPGWWQQFDLPAAPYIELEGAARGIRNWETALIPGLLQTPVYARHVVSSWDRRITEEQSANIADARRRRQARLVDENPVRLHAIVDEAVLHRIVGDRYVMKAQIEHLLEVMQLPNVTVQIAPFIAGAHEAVNSPFALLELEDPIYGDVVFVEGLAGYLYLEKLEHLHRFAEVFESLTSIAFGEDDTAAYLWNISK